MEFNNENHAVEILAELFRQQQSVAHLCDVTLKVEDSDIPVHSCILSACSDYFRTLLTGNFEDCQAREFEIPNATSDAVLNVLSFMYTGKITIGMADVDEILALADYFCIEKLKDYCNSFLKDNINEENCLVTKLVADKYSLSALSEDTTRYISPRFAGLLQAPEALELPVDFVLQLLKDPDFNYIREQDIVEFILRWINHDNDDREQYFARLFNCVELSYISRTFMLETLFEDPIVISNVAEDVIQTAVKHAADQHRRRSEDILVCRSRNIHIGDEVKLLGYIIQEDEWVSLKVPEPHVFDGLESMIHHKDLLYFLVSKTEDMYGYMHHTEENKYFWKFDLRRNTWEHLPAPKGVKGLCRLISHVNGVYVIDRSGRVEEFNTDTNDWRPCCDNPFFEYPSATWYVLPMPVDRYIFFLRVFSAGYAFSYSQLSFRLYKFDTVHKTCEALSEIEAGEVDIEDHERFHGYVARPGAVTLKNELGESRLRYDYRDGHWSSRKPRIVLPNMVKEVWGIVESMDRVYFVGKTKEDSPCFMFYDHARGRFKAIAPPPSYISGLLCLVSVPKTTLRQMVVNDS